MSHRNSPRPKRSSMAAVIADNDHLETSVQQLTEQVTVESSTCAVCPCVSCAVCPQYYPVNIYTHATYVITCAHLKTVNTHVHTYTNMYAYTNTLAHGRTHAHKYACTMHTRTSTHIHKHTQDNAQHIH